MEKISLINIIGIISVFVCLLLAVFLITVKTKHKLSNRLFASFLILTALDLSGWILPLFVNHPSNLGMLRGLLSYLQMPVFYLYVVSICYSDFKLKPKHLLHIIPFIIVNLVLTPRFYMVDLPSKIELWMNYNEIIEMKFIHITIHLQFIIYIVLIFITLKRFKNIYKENYANANTLTYKWLFQLTLVSAIAHSIVIIKNIFKFTQYENVFEWTQLFVGFFVICITCWYVLMALNYPQLFRSVDSNLKLINDIISEEKKNETKVENNINTEQIAILKNYMISEEPFLEPSLSIQDLSQRIQIPVRDMSILINHQLGQHFFDFVNEYRILKSKQILEDPSKNKLTILEILYEVGFNSKSSFNTAFKKHTGVTPTIYRKKHLKSTT